MTCLRCHHNVEAHAGSDGCLARDCPCELNRGAAITLHTKPLPTSIHSRNQEDA